MTGVRVYDLASRWPDSAGEPLALFEGEDPPLSAGSYVVEPGERVPAEGTTSHEGTEVSVVLSGTVVLGLASGEERTVEAESMAVIPAGVDHYSENRTDRPVELVYVVVGGL